MTSFCLMEGGIPVFVEPNTGYNTETATENTSIDNNENKVATASAHSLESGPTENNGPENTQHSQICKIVEVRGNAFWLDTQDDLNLQNALSSMFTTTFESIPNMGDDRARALFRSTSFPDTK